VGAANAKELIFTGERIDSATALRVGLINRVLPPGGLEDDTRSLAQTIAENAPLSILAAKRSVDACAADLTPDALRVLDELVEKCFASADYEEGRKAFAEKRKPNFTGR
jgi:enoyl-CoA hydratase/carnithine racemase